ncbi:aldehyde dehydrogenase family protein [Devosia sediminis]|uniref:Aldehyde dehydrogenase family protein n=1 Tax=Devosia sediminis TaxID=2798801 RepID=A0A934MLB3_9HYPH|nr:aldehyde dehydrogenase family protein [Devosia sediminis]MBJ3784980.1 aldehyde dehydrogenase family protein [Devosia sediminis]
MILEQALVAARAVALTHRIGGEALPAPATRVLIDPRRAEPFAEAPDAAVADVEAAVAAARSALAGPWRRMKPVDRGRLLSAVAKRLLEEQDRFAMVETLNMGKPLRQARGDVSGAVRFFEYYAGMADKLQGETIPLGPGMMAWTEREPVGVTAQIVPWNGPLGMLARGLAPALAAGCTAVVKPAETTPLTAVMLADLLTEVGLPPGVVNVVLGPGTTGAALAAHPGINHITFTGSVATGKAVMAAAATHLASVTLELGGKSPVVVLDDADLDAAAEGVVRGITTNAGQVCAAGSRLIVDRRVASALIDRVVARIGTLSLGHGLEDPDIGPLASEIQHRRVLGAVGHAVAHGDHILWGGERPDRAGYFVNPAVLSTTPSSPLAQEEVFGPVLAVLEVDDPAHALRVANDSRYGLVAGIYSRNIDRALAFARAAEVGQVFVNRYLSGGVETPVGGVKNSGFGREKGLRGLDAYLRTKCTTVAFDEA